MSVGRLCTRTVSIASADEPVLEAARRMRDHDVGTLAVLDAERRPIGVLTDRDVVLRVVAAGRDPATTPIGDVMSRPAVMVHEETPIEDALARMAGNATRRLLVVDDEGRLVGVLALDDVLDLLAEEAAAIGRLIRR